MPASASKPPRLRQAVLAASELDATARALSDLLGLGEPYADPAVAIFGLRNAVFALEDTFLEVVSPQQPGTSAGRFLERRGGDSGYMVMLEVADLEAARERARGLGVREVWEVELDDIAEVHLHPRDMDDTIVALSQPVPAGSWRWGGPGWPQRAAPRSVAGVTIGAADPVAARERWAEILGDPSAPGLAFEDNGSGLTAVRVEGFAGAPAELGGVRFSA